ncbi:MAG: EVE domain-containing protein, partial [Gammaproteobacteria bacterium]
MQYWLMKSEPSEFSIDDLKNIKVEPWDGVRNYQARNMMNKEMKKGDLAFMYHSNCDEIGIVGIMTIVREGYVDYTAFDKKDKHY